MKTQSRIILAALSLNFVTQAALANIAVTSEGTKSSKIERLPNQVNDDIQADITEGKILAAMEMMKVNALEDMGDIVKELMNRQEAVGMEGIEDGRLSAIGQYIEVITQTMKDVQKLDSEKVGEIQNALNSARQLRDEVRAMK